MELKHAYWGVVCKTPSCAGLIPAKYLGLYDEKKSLYSLPDEAAGPWDIECTGCWNRHRYTRDDLRVKSAGVAPPSNFQNWW